MATAANLPAQTRANPVTVIHQNLDQMAPELAKALPAHVTIEKFVRVAKTAIINNPDLQKADRPSLFGAIGRLAQDGLLPDGREAAIVMFGNKAQAMPMIAGVLKKVRQSGDVSRVSAQVVYANDHFVWKLGFDEDVEHNPPPLDKPRGDPIGAYATAVLKDGSRLLEVMSLEEIEKVRSVSRAKNNGPWVQWWGEMARKTVMRRLSKRLPMSTDLIDELDRDPTMAAEPQAIEHVPAPAPRSRLDALEDQIGATAIEGEIVDDATHEVDQDAQFAEIVADEGEGPADEQRGEHDALRQTADRLIADAKSKELLADLTAMERSADFNDAYATLDDDLKLTVDGEIAQVRAKLQGGQ